MGSGQSSGTQKKKVEDEALAMDIINAMTVGMTKMKEKQEAEDERMKEIQAIAVAAGAVAFAGWGLCKLFGIVSESSDKVKMMKAPGRDYKMPRAAFESNPSGYFRDLRK